MRKFISYIICVITLLVMVQCDNKGGVKEETIPFLQKNGGALQLMVNDEPFLMIAGELHNSTSSTVEYMEPVWARLKSMNLNTVLAAVTWELLEPEEGIFDYHLVDVMLQKARENDLRLCLLWFGSWKNGESSYVPGWVKKDTERFFRVKNKDGKNIETISPFCREARKADAKAFGALMKYLSEVDKERTVILIQPENEVGVFQEIDYCPQALVGFEKEVPEKLMTYLEDNKDMLNQHVKEIWESKGSVKAGTWKEVFGDTPFTKEFFMAWQYADYIDEVARVGKEQYPLPMFVNAWLVQYPEQLPGGYPTGGPVSRVIDIYKAAAGHLDILTPDIYLPDFKRIVAEYHRPDNPLLIPESTMEPGRAFYAFAEHDAIGFAPFAIEDEGEHFLLIKSYEVLQELQSLIIRYQGTGKMRGILKYGDEMEQVFPFKDYTLKVVYEKNNEPAYGLIIQTDIDEFLVAGMNFKVFISANDPNKIGYFEQIWEGGYEAGEWSSARLLNGDETWHNYALIAVGRLYDSSEVNASKGFLEAEGEQNFTYSYASRKKIATPGIYKAKVYIRN